jgi:hypothetical protein
MFKQLARGAAGVALALISGAAAAQTASFKCPKPGATFQYSDGASSTWIAQEGNSCRFANRAPNGTESSVVWFAPTMTARPEHSQSYARQLKPETLWPLAVGKKIVGRYDGAGSQVGSQGSWHNNISVDGYEKVTTKAGTFDTFVITKQEEALSHKYRSTLKLWYAPELGVTVKFTFTDNNGSNRSAELVTIPQ